MSTLQNRHVLSRSLPLHRLLNLAAFPPRIFLEIGLKNQRRKFDSMGGSKQIENPII